MAAAAFAWAWWATSWRLLTSVNWDASVYLAQCATGQLHLSSPPWNAHYAVGHIYVAAAAVARLFGGSCVDGFRLADAVAFALAVFVVAEATRRLAGSIAVATGATALFATGYPLSFELMTLEDNVLFFAPAALALFVAAARFADWRRRDSIVAGVAAAVAALISWQAILYLGPPGYAALFGRGRAWKQRARDVTVLLAVFAATVLVYGALLWAVTSLSAHDVFVARNSGILRRPAGNFALRPPLGRDAFFDLGAGVVYALWASGYDLPPHHPNLPLVGALVTAVAALLVWPATRRARASGDWSAHVVAVAALAFTVATPIYRDHTYRFLLRVDYLPLVAAFGIAAAARALPARRWMSAAVAATLILVAALQVRAALEWRRARVARYPSFYRFVHDVRQNNPACIFVFAVDELREAYWNFEIPALLESELPRWVAVGDDVTPLRWRFPLRALSPQKARAELPVCAWLSAAAARALDGK